MASPRRLAAILDEKVDEATAKVISITENLVRRDPPLNDLIDACTALFKRYGSVKSVAQELGLPPVIEKLCEAFYFLQKLVPTLVRGAHHT